uniref:Phosphodiesterase 4D interacting protein n=1 Tax=Nothobranchius furzeri TaxID=105023 RepID=A0A1A7ZLP6_NOTFU
MTDLCGDEADNSPPLQLHTLKQFEQHLNDLKKENFSLKLRIYFLEERIQQKYEESSEDVYRTNIELKVEVESLKKELQEKQELLDKALTTAESLTSDNEAERQRRCQERQQEIDHMQQVLETKIQLLQEEAQLARGEAERMASLAGSHSHASLASLDTAMEEVPEDESPPHILSPSSSSKDRLIEDLTKELLSKEALVSELCGEKKTLTLRVEELEEQVQELSSSLLQKDKDVEFYQEELSHERLRIEEEMQSLVEEQQSQLNQYECAAGQCVSELQKAQLQVQSLQAKIQESEANNMKLQEKLTEMECELRLLRQAAQSQDRTIQGLTESISTKDNEAQELYHLIEGQNNTLCKLQELAHRNQLTQSQAPVGMSESLTLAQLQTELVRVQSSLFSVGLELEASQRNLKQSQRQGDDLLRFRDRLNSDLQEALQHREVTEKHNQDLSSALQKTRSELQITEAALKACEAEKLAATAEKDKVIEQLKRFLQDKEQQLQDYSEMLESTKSSKPRDVLLEKLRERIKERDKALERSIDDKFSCLEERDSQVRRLQLALREKERDLERLRCILSNNEETILSLDTLVRGKDLELEQAAEAYRNLQWLKQKGEEKDRNALREKDAITNQLQAALQTRSQEVQDLTASLVARVQAGPAEVVEELKARLALKEKLFQELLSDRSCQANEHQAQVQDLLNALTSKDQYLQDYSYRLSLVISERTNQQQELRKQLTQAEQKLCGLRSDKEETGGEAEQLRRLLKEKETFIKELIQAQGEAVQKEHEAEMKALQEDLQQVLKKEMEARKEISVLRQSLDEVVAKDSTDHQSVLEQLVSEYNKLNDALKAEKRSYQNLTRLLRSDGNLEKIQGLHTELDSVQALRGQLEEVLTRTRRTALSLERAAKGQAVSGGGNGQGPASEAAGGTLTIAQRR